MTFHQKYCYLFAVGSELNDVSSVLLLPVFAVSSEFTYLLT